MYLSPAFSKRTIEELEFLRNVHGRTGFSLFWIDIVRPLLCEMRVKCVLEIGAYEGDHTRLLLQYCEAADGTLIVIEPEVRPALRKILDGSKRVSLLAETSRAALPRVNAPVDAVLLEGDLNYYTVHGDLKDIAGLSHRVGVRFPLVFFANAAWPYARRDMYYNPENLPSGTRREYAREGLTPWSAGLEEGMINYPFANAAVEGGPRNGVLTAAEDFVAGAGERLRFFVLPVNHGLGIICLAGSREEAFVQANLVPPPALARFLETWELARLNTIVSGLRARRDRDRRSGPQAWVARQVRRIGRRLMARMDS